MTNKLEEQGNEVKGAVLQDCFVCRQHQGVRSAAQHDKYKGIYVLYAFCFQCNSVLVGNCELNGDDVLQNRTETTCKKNLTVTLNGKALVRGNCLYFSSIAIA